MQENPNSSLSKNLNMFDWIDESYKLAKTFVYTIDGHSPSSDYVSKGTQIC